MNPKKKRATAASVRTGGGGTEEKIKHVPPFLRENDSAFKNELTLFRRWLP